MIRYFFLSSILCLLFFFVIKFQFGIQPKIMIIKCASELVLKHTYICCYKLCLKSFQSDLEWMNNSERNYLFCTYIFIQHSLIIMRLHCEEQRRKVYCKDRVLFDKAQFTLIIKPPKIKSLKTKQNSEQKSNNLRNQIFSFWFIITLIKCVYILISYNIISMKIDINNCINCYFITTFSLQWTIQQHVR